MAVLTSERQYHHLIADKQQKLNALNFMMFVLFRCLHQPLHIKLSVCSPLCCIVTGLNQTNVQCTMFYCSRPAPAHIRGAEDDGGDGAEHGGSSGWRGG